MYKSGKLIFNCGGNVLVARGAISIRLILHSTTEIMQRDLNFALICQLALDLPTVLD